MKNILYIIIDGLRYDTVSDKDTFINMMPNLASIANDASLACQVAHAPNTQYALTALLSASYPLDEGGYNSGIKYRNYSAVEQIKNEGYATGLFSSCEQYNRDLGFDRGFDTISVSVNNRRVLQQEIKHRVSYLVTKWANKEITDEVISSKLQKEYAEILIMLEKSGLDEMRNKGLPSYMVRRNKNLALACRKELHLLQQEPLEVAKKLLNTPEHFFWVVLGYKSRPVKLLLARILNKIFYLATSKISSAWYKGNKLDEYRAVAEEVVPQSINFIRESKKPWFNLIHLQDCHTYQFSPDHIYRKPFVVINKILSAFSLKEKRKNTGSNRPLLYDINLSYLDKQLSRIIDYLDNSGEIKNTLIILTSDHGTHFSNIDKRSQPDLTKRFYRSCIESPFLAINNKTDNMPDVFPAKSSLSFVSSMAKNEMIESSYDNSLIISEHAGRGYCDLNNKLYFTVLVELRYKAFTVLDGKKLTITEFYDLKEDPFEHENLANDSIYKEQKNTLLMKLYQERQEIFAKRGVDLLSEKSNHEQALRSVS